MSEFITDEVREAAAAIYNRRNGYGGYPFSRQPKIHQNEYIQDVLAALPLLEKAIRADERKKIAAHIGNEVSDVADTEYERGYNIGMLSAAAAIRARGE